MKYIVIGLGIFGASMAEELTQMGNEVIGVDINLDRVENIKEKITHAVSLDATDVDAVKNLPIEDTDVVIIGIGEDKGANIMTAALMKQLRVKRLISRAVDPLQQMVLEAMEINEIIHPENETAIRWAKKLNMEGVVDSFELDDDYSIVETTIPKYYNGKKLMDLNIKEEFNLLVLTTIKVSVKPNDIGIKKNCTSVQEIARAETIMHSGDLMVLYGHKKDIKRLLNENKKMSQGM